MTWASKSAAAESTLPADAADGVLSVEAGPIRCQRKQEGETITDSPPASAFEAEGVPSLSADGDSAAAPADAAAAAAAAAAKLDLRVCSGPLKYRSTALSKSRFS